MAESCGLPCVRRIPTSQIWVVIKNGWGGWIRTNEWRYQKPLPYRLATPQLIGVWGMV